MIFVKSKILYFLKWPSVAIEENFSGSFKCLFKNKRNKYVRNNLSRFILSVSLILFFFHFVLCSTIENVEILKNDYNTLTESHNIINRRSRNLGANPESISLGYELSEKDEGNKNDLINSATDVSTELENLKERLFPELELYTNDQNSRNNTPNLRKGSLGFDSFKKLELGTLNQFDKDKMINLKDETNMNEFEGSLGRNSMASNVVTSELFDEPVDDSSSTTTSTGTKLQNVPSNDNNGELLKDEPIDDYINNNSKVESEDNYYAQQNMQSQSKDNYASEQNVADQSTDNYPTQHDVPVQLRDNYASEQEYFDRGEQLNDVSADNNTNEPVDDNTSNILKDEPVDDHAGKHLKDEPVDDHAGKHMKDEPVDIDRTNIKKGLNEQHVNPWTTTLADLKNINNSMKIEKNNKSNEQVKNTSVSKSCDIIKPSKFNKKNLFEQRLQSVEGKNFFEGRSNFDERSQNVEGRSHFDERAPNVEERRYMDPRNPNIPDVRFPHHQWGQGMMYGRPYYPWVPFMGDGRGYNFYNPHQHMVYGRPYYWVPPPPALEYTKGFNPMEQRREEDRGHMGGRGSRYPEEERYNYNNKRSNSIPEGRNYEENAYERGGGNNKWDFRNMYDRLRDEDENDYDQPPSTSSSNRGRGNERYSQSRDRREERNNYNSDYYTRGNERTYNNSNVTSSSNRELIPYKKEILPFGVSNSELEDKLTEEELNERIRRLDYTVSVKDMFILWNHILAHERKKYTKMQEYLMYYSQYLEKTYLVPTAFRKKYWWRVHYMLTEEVVKRERTDNLDFHQFLRKGSCEKREFLYFINSKRKGWADLTETMKNIWMERLTYKMRKYSGA
ncbi:hypothetical protein PFNF135_02051 [Plasmodium falciparum NF135/5.C10]|uniref:Plasmodium RESA N-terminal domain-containing protein n=2 Tax=Plasmodium falciparum TaxID=5833 RepID=A0A024V8P3_PLAFA|nr:hypothetical protein PFFVO_01927 [Plasmodium falciparum Vietnam Oak-Knoll (FVO)]ETW43514.1 hypothetical protein PFNF135_02051 [Plasmodium falciparum NF135/5.C10]